MCWRYWKLIESGGVAFLPNWNEWMQAVFGDTALVSVFNLKKEKNKDSRVKYWPSFACGSPSPHPPTYATVFWSKYQHIHKTFTFSLLIGCSPASSLSQQLVAAMRCTRPSEADPCSGLFTHHMNFLRPEYCLLLLFNIFVLDCSHNPLVIYLIWKVE